jgi:SNF2 family DNA or RNA helicase
LNEPVRIDLREDGLIRIDAGYHEKDNIKDSVPGARWKHKDREWVCPLSWAAFQQLRGVFKDRLQVSPQLEALAWEVYEHRVKPCLELRQASDCPSVDEPKLSPLQRACVGFLSTARQALLSDPLGAGKTPMTIRALARLQALHGDVFPAVVVAPNSVKPHWRNEFATWWPDVDVAVVTGNAKKRREILAEEHDVYVLNWEALHLHSRLAGFGSVKLSDKEKEEKELNGMPIRTVVADEAHRAKAPKSKQTRALWAVGDKAEYRFALTGTPVANTPEDLWAVMRFVSPQEYPSKAKWVERYGLMRYSPFGRMECVGLRGDTREELVRFLDPRFIRRPKNIILPDLPEKLPPTIRVVDLAPKQKKAYDSLRKEMLAELDGGVLMASNPMQRVLRLRQLAGATGEIDEEGNVTLKEPSSKVDDLIDVVEELGEDKIIVWSDSRQLAEIAHARLVKEGVDAALFTGKVDPAERERNRAAFQEGDLQVLVLTFGAGAEGINLSRADAQVFLERSWSAVKNGQAEERAQRKGRVGNLRTIDIVAADTVDKDVIDTYGTKLERLEEVVRDEETLRRWLS